MFRKNILTAAILSAVAAIVYIFTAPPSITTGDSGELAAAVYFWGIPHPTGFPLYIILAKLFSYFLPWMEFAARLNVFSALCGAATAGIVFLISQKLKINYWAGAASALSLAFGFSFWSHAGTIQVYSLTAMFFTLAVFIFLHWLETKKMRHLYLLAIICGLGAGAHLTFLLFFPFAIIYFLFKKKEIKISVKFYLLSFIFYLLSAALIYSYLPLRAAQSPELNWGDPSTRKNFIYYITQRDYAEKIGNRGLESWTLMLKETVRLFGMEFTWLGALAVLAGAAIIWKKNKPFFYAGASVIFFNILLLGNYGNSEDIVILWRYFLPSYAVMAVFLAYALSVIPAKAGIMSLLLPAVIFASHFGALNRRGYDLIQKVSGDLLASAPQNSIFITSGDSITGAMMYEQKVLGKRQDLAIVDDRLYTHTWYLGKKKTELESKNFVFADNLSFLAKENAGKVYSAVNSISFLKVNFDFAPEGLAYKLYGKKDIVNYAELKKINDDFWGAKDLEFLKNKNFAKNYLDSELVGLYTGALNNLGALLVNNRLVQDGIGYFKKSLSIRDNENALYNLWGIYNALGEKEKAAEYKTRFDALGRPS